MHHGRRPFGVLNSVLVQNLLRFCSKKGQRNTHKKTVIKMCSILRPQATKNQILKYLGLIIVLRYQLTSIHKMNAGERLQFCQNFGILENHVIYEGAFLDISKSE